MVGGCVVLVVCVLEVLKKTSKTMDLMKKESCKTKPHL